MSMRRARLAQALGGRGERGNPRQLQPSQAGQSFPIPAPTLGMNTRDGVQALDPREARLLENLICESGVVQIRAGKTDHQDIAGASAVGKVFTHVGVTSNVLLAAADGEIFDVTGAPNPLTAASYTSNNWIMAQFNDTTIGVNGQDTPWAFDGSTVGASGLSGSGLSIENLRTVALVGVRLWFTEVNSADVWYLDASAVTGTLTKFQLSQETKGGYCVGVYEYRSFTVFVMSTGEIAVYQGDPGQDLAIASRYQAPKPVGYDPGLAVSGDLILMTESHPIPFESVAAGLGFDDLSLTKWGKIGPSWASDFLSFGALEPWTGTFFKGLVIFNIPTDASTSKQWVFNTRTKAWQYFTGLNGFNFSELNGVLYFGERGAGTVVANQGGTDNGEQIVALARQGFTYPFADTVNAECHLGRLNVSATGAVTAQLQLDINFEEGGLSSPEFSVATSGSGPWDGPWDEPWGEDGQAKLTWQSVKGFGRAIAPVVAFRSQADVLKWSATDIIASAAGAVG